LRELWRHLEETFEDNSEARLKYQAMCPGDNTGDGPASPKDLQEDLFNRSENSF
jgi:hypothetical protein